MLRGSSPDRTRSTPHPRASRRGACRSAHRGPGRRPRSPLTPSRPIHEWLERERPSVEMNGDDAPRAGTDRRLDPLGRDQSRLRVDVDKARVAPTSVTASAVATNEFAGTRASSPGPISSARKARIRASVPEETATACRGAAVAGPFGFKRRPWASKALAAVTAPDRCRILHQNSGPRCRAERWATRSISALMVTPPLFLRNGAARSLDTPPSSKSRRSRSIPITGEHMRSGMHIVGPARTANGSCRSCGESRQRRRMACIG